MSFPAPIGGWIANRSLAIGRDPKLPPGAAVLDNWFPTATGITLRRGRELRFNIGAGPVLSMFRYSSGATERLFASISGPVIDITTDTPATVHASGTNGDWRVQQFSTAGGDFIIGVNGSDAAWIYNGTAFAATTITFPAGSGLTTANLSAVWSYGKRLWFVQKDSLNVWYLPVDSIGGELVKFPLGGIFTLGGVMLWGQPWSLSSGGQGGLSEQVVFCTTEGEVLVYQGADPGSASGFSRVGLYRIGEPLGGKAFMRAGGDLLIATTVGLISLAQAASRDFSALGAAAASYPIEEAWVSAINRRGVVDWRCHIWPEGRMLLVAPPQDNNPTCFVANSNTGAWARFTNWEISSMAVIGGQLQFGDMSGNIWLANVTGSDEGTPYTGVCIPLFEDMGAPANRKLARNGRVVKRSRFDADEKLTAVFDFKASPPPPPSTPSDAGASVWGSGVWGESVWGDEGADIVTTAWRSLGGSGQDVSVCLQVTSGNLTPIDVELIRIDATIEIAGVIS